jgi:uncharacterized phage-associated protein
MNHAIDILKVVFHTISTREGAMANESHKIADTIIALSRKRSLEITNLKLQKLLYYSQAWNLVFKGKPLFLESIEAWIHGPVVPSMFRRFKEYRWSPITCSVEASDDVAIIEHIESVLAAYGKFDASQLERLTHHEDPWIEARRGLEPDAPSRNVISHSAMRNFYSSRLALANA